MSKVVYRFPSHGVDADVSLEDDGNGNYIVTVEPYFWKPDAKPNVAFVTSQDNNSNVICREVQQLSGATLQLGHAIRRNPVRPRYESAEGKDK